MSKPVISLDLMVRWLTGQASLDEFPQEAREWAQKVGEETAEMLKESLWTKDQWDE